jgi:hypothetical protein
VTVTRRRAAVVAIAATAAAVAALALVAFVMGASGGHAAISRQPNAGATLPFVAYRGPHRIGDRIGPNAKVAAVNGAGDPTAVVSTNGQAPMVWSFEVSTAVAPHAGTPVRGADPSVWLDPACPSAMCPSLPASAPLPTPPPALAVDPCAAVPASSVSSLLGAKSVVTSSPQVGTCVWNSGERGAQVEVGGAAWWAYLQQFPALYGPVGSALVDDHDGLRIAVRSGDVVAIVLTDAGQSVSQWQGVGEEVAAWAASR